MTLAEALAALGLPPDATRADAKRRCRAWTNGAEWDTGTGRAFWFVAAWVDGDSEQTIANREFSGDWGKRGLGSDRVRQAGRDAQTAKREARRREARRMRAHGMTPAEIARALGVTLQAVYSYLREAA